MRISYKSRNRQYTPNRLRIGRFFIPVRFPEGPYLYKVRTSVMDQGSDSYDTVFGIRRTEFDVDRGFLLNGKQARLNGVCVNHDGGAVGAAAPERVWERRLEILKAMGCNSIRTAHNPYAPEFLELCDKLGFMVMNEVFDEWKQNKTANGYGQYFDEWSERDVTSFVRRDRNHPSVLLWSAGNEIGEHVATNGVETVKRLVDIFHREDPTRPVTMGCDRIAANLTGREVGTPGKSSPPERRLRSHSPSTAPPSRPTAGTSRTARSRYSTRRAG